MDLISSIRFYCESLINTKHTAYMLRGLLRPFLHVCNFSKEVKSCVWDSHKSYDILYMVYAAFHPVTAGMCPQPTHVTLKEMKHLQEVTPCFWLWQLNETPLIKKKKKSRLNCQIEKEKINFKTKQLKGATLESARLKLDRTGIDKGSLSASGAVNTCLSFLGFKDT